MRSITVKYKNLKYAVLVPLIISCLLLSIIYSAPSVAQEENYKIKSMKIVKVGKKALNKDARKDMVNKIFKNNPAFESNPYYIGRPVLLHVVFSCNLTPKKVYTLNVESDQAQNKWGEWKTDTEIVKRNLSNYCSQTKEAKEAEKTRIREAAIAQEAWMKKEAEEEARIKEAAAKRVVSMFPDKITMRNDGRFVAFVDDTVLDIRTNLLWAARDNGKHVNWDEAKSYCENYRGGGYTDWRMPTNNELAGLYIGKKNKNNHLTELIDLRSYAAWSSDTKSSKAAIYLFDQGLQGWIIKSGDGYDFRALPVRSVK